MSTPSTTEIVILSAVRTAFGSFQGMYSGVPTTQLGATAVKAAVERAGLTPEQFADGGEVILGNVLMAGEGQAPARQSVIYAGLPKSVPASTLNKVCGSGMKALIQGAQTLLAGDATYVLSGGMENMTRAPYLMPAGRGGARLGHTQLLDSMIEDGLWDPYNSQHMGNCAELCAKEFKFTREAQDAYAMESFKRAQAAQKSGAFKSEIVPVSVPGKKGETTTLDTDEGPSKANFEKMPQLKPVFDKSGTVTAANASTINDGAAALVLTTRAHAAAKGLKPIARVVSWAGHAQEPLWFTTAPVTAMKRAMDKAGWKVSDVDLFEVNEAFAVVAMAAQKELGLPHEKLNVNGGAISLGHPIGASGARIVVTLIHALKTRGLKRGVAGICIGGGEGLAVCVELA